MMVYNMDMDQQITRMPLKNYHVIGPCIGRAGECEPVLRALPGWFGIEEAVENYVKEIGGLPTFLAYAQEGGEAGGALGFLTIKQHYPKSAEVLVMGIHPEAHRQGLGRALMQAAEGWLRGQGVEYLQVKTLGEAHPDENYAKTRAFYRSMGFTPLEEFPLLWDADNPCLLLVKRITP